MGRCCLALGPKNPQCYAKKNASANWVDQAREGDASDGGTQPAMCLWARLVRAHCPSRSQYQSRVVLSVPANNICSAAAGTRRQSSFYLALLVATAWTTVPAPEAQRAESRGPCSQKFWDQLGLSGAEPFSAVVSSCLRQWFIGCQWLFASGTCRRPSPRHCGIWGHIWSSDLQESLDKLAGKLVCLLSRRSSTAIAGIRADIVIWGPIWVDV